MDFKAMFGLSLLAAGVQIAAAGEAQERLSGPEMWYSWSSDFCKGFRFNLLVRDDDGKGVESWIEPRPEMFRNADPRRLELIKYVRRKSSPESVSGSRKK